VKKLAIFVEGQTERVFIEKLLSEVIGTRHLRIETYVAAGGGSSGARSLQLLGVIDPASGARFLAMIVDCGSDGRVRSDIADRYDKLVAAGYSAIIGIRDVYPDVMYVDIPKLRIGLQLGLKDNPIKVLFVLGVMEIESWFLSEFTHFARLDSRLTPAVILHHLGFNPKTDDMQLRAHPASDLNDAYHIVGRAYDKSRKRIQKTIDLLDYAHLYMAMKGRLPDLDALNASLDQFLS
jgi:hypothetical protein